MDGGIFLFPPSQNSQSECVRLFLWIETKYS